MSWYTLNRRHQRKVYACAPANIMEKMLIMSFYNVSCPHVAMTNQYIMHIPLIYISHLLVIWVELEMMTFLYNVYCKEILWFFVNILTCVFVLYIYGTYCTKNTLVYGNNDIIIKWPEELQFDKLFCLMSIFNNKESHKNHIL